jgi:diguanylate cyclase (GGDEF)-like protein
MATPTHSWPLKALHASIADTPHAVALVDHRGRIRAANASFGAVCRRSGHDLVGYDVAAALEAPADGALHRTIEQSRRAGEARVTLVSEQMSGTRYLDVVLQTDADDGWTLLSAQDLSNEYRLSEELRERTSRDGLTGLHNREVLHSELTHLLAAGRPAAVLMLDVDNFKIVNDTFGHAYGDDLLKAIGSRIASICEVRSIIARLGGDEFAVLLHLIADEDVASDLASEICAALSEPFALGDRLIHTSCSIGVTLGRGATHTASDMLREADTAAYRAKANGRNGWVLFTDDLRAEVEQRFELEAHLRSVLESRKMGAAFQGIFDRDSLELRAVEALARLEAPGGEAIPVGAFLEVAEQSRLLLPLTEGVLETALATLGAAIGDPDGPRLTLNVSPAQLTDARLVDSLLGVLDRHGVDPARLVVEITEREQIPRCAAARRSLRTLSDTGMSLAIDDFGAGASSLGYLVDLPVECVKLDRSLVQQLGVNARAETIISSVIELCASLGLDVIGEGVETEGQLRALRRLGCENVQGYLLHMPCGPEGAATIRAGARATV